MRSQTKWLLSILGIALLCGPLAGRVGAQSALESPGCVYDRTIYPEGSEVCQNGTKKRCESGAWGNIGMCEDEAPPPPYSSGGDLEQGEY